MFSERIEKALAASLAAHEGQLRKGGSAVPYGVHPAHVAILLTRWGLDDDVIAAGLLHDVVEDSPDWTQARIEAEFGAHVSSIVEQLTEDKARSWDERKQWAIDHVPRMSPEAASVKAADKLHNLQTLTAQLRDCSDPDQVWAHFTGGRERTLEMSDKLVDVLERRVDPKIARALRGAMNALLEQAESGARPRVSRQP